MPGTGKYPALRNNRAGPDSRGISNRATGSPHRFSDGSRRGNGVPGSAATPCRCAARLGHAYRSPVATSVRGAWLLHLYTHAIGIDETTTIETYRRERHACLPSSVGVGSLWPRCCLPPASPHLLCRSTDSKAGREVRSRPAQLDGSSSSNHSGCLVHPARPASVSSGSGPISSNATPDPHGTSQLNRQPEAEIRQGLPSVARPMRKRIGWSRVTSSIRAVCDLTRTDCL